MQRILNVGASTPVLIGLDWTALSREPREQKREMKTQLKFSGASHAILLSAGDSSAYGAGQAGRNTVSAAAWLALAVGAGRSLIVIKHLGGEEVWLCAIYKGLPLPRGDRILPRSRLLSALEDLMMAHDRSDFEFLLDGMQDAMLQEFAAFRPGSIDVLLQGTPPEQAKLVKAAGRGRLIAGLALLLLVVLGGVGYWQYRVYQEEERLRQEALKAQQQIPPDQQFMKNFLAYYAGRPRFPAVEFLDAAYKRAGKVALEQSGWRITSIDCQAATQTCTYDLVRRPFFGPLALRADQFDTLEQGMDTAKASARFDLAPKTLPAIARPMDIAAAFPSKAASSVAMLPPFQTAKDIGLAMELGAAAPIPNVSVPASPVDVQEGKWSVSGSSLAMDIVRKLDPALFYADSVTIEPGEKLSFAFAGTYLVSIGGPAPTATATGVPVATPAPPVPTAAPGAATPVAPAAMPPAAPTASPKGP
ncbi:type 4b pilus protein PilO2 [Noviherbaspirillum galbum]|uniref:Type 4b pilus protein PilO2 n=1 Tax=Noviherbaspirillum galbum TaxID=2709383 RepID=A0A6B3SU16_9BURK|nr:type 4b pilus protein PilO2 [Noviherbaspirillum galbum]NEX64217.1 type 4b pilus protein PilO2 [Noviherbaspirillum galbum]